MDKKPPTNPVARKLFDAAKDHGRVGSHAYVPDELRLEAIAELERLELIAKSKSIGMLVIGD
jgi:hypothetical protein